MLHLIGGLVGYVLPRLSGFTEVESRTMAIETSMKSSAFRFPLGQASFWSICSSYSLCSQCGVDGFDGIHLGSDLALYSSQGW